MLTDSRDKNYAFNMIDCPGHPNFSDEVTASLRLADNVLLVVDVLEGMTTYLNQLIHMALKNGSKIILVINKLDRLVLELKLPPNDAYHKIKHTLDEVNMAVQAFKTINPNISDQDYFSPLHGNVIFASTLFHTIFSLESFANVYHQRQLKANKAQFKSQHKHGNTCRTQSKQLDPSKFAKFLWGNIFYNIETRKFQKEKTSDETPRSFVHFILEPFYKIISLTLTKDKSEMMRIIKDELNGADVKAKDLEINVRPLLKLVMRNTFG